MRARALILSMLALAVTPAAADSTAAARAFFERYVEMERSYDPGIARLYADDAAIRSYRRYPHGLERAMELSGAQWKRLIAQAMPLARAQGDRSRYSAVKVAAAGMRATIRAVRYSERKCYTDTAYYMVIERRDDGRYLIVEEYSETQPQSDC